MKVRQILLGAWRTYTAHFGALLQGLLLQAVVCLIALAPLLFLSVPQAAPLAWLCPVLFVLLVLPMRQNAAQALASLLDGAEYPLGQVVSFQDYGRKLLCSLRQGLCLVVWGLPCLAVTNPSDTEAEPPRVRRSVFFCTQFPKDCIRLSKSKSSPIKVPNTMERMAISVFSPLRHPLMPMRSTHRATLFIMMS